jgi:hypothetical protein
MSPTDEYPALAQLVSVCFQDDWPFEMLGCHAAIDRFKLEVPATLTLEARSDIRRLLTNANVEILDDVLAGLGCYFYPASSGLDTREWLEYLDEFLDTPV